MLATPGELPIGGDWAFEVKWDGIRVLVSVGDGRVRVGTRSGSDRSSAFPELAPLAGVLPEGTMVDGELVVLADGLPSFHSLAPRLHANPSRSASLAVTAPATLLAFDLLVDAGQDITPRTYVERRETLVARLAPGPSWQVPESFDDGSALWSATEQRGLEGVVAKRRASRYRPGVRHPDWVKVPHRRTRSYVVGGHRPGSSPGPGRLGSLLVGTPVGDGLLAYDGAVGSGLSAAQVAALRPVLDDLQVAAPRFAGRDLLPADGVWCEPVLVVDVANLGRGGNGLLRQPAVVRIRTDRGYHDLLTEGG